MSTNVNIDGVIYRDMVFIARPLSKTNPEFVKAEKEFLAGKRWTFIKVQFEFPDGTSTSPQKPKPDKTL